MTKIWRRSLAPTLLVGALAGALAMTGTALAATLTFSVGPIPLPPATICVTNGSPPVSQCVTTTTSATLTGTLTLNATVGPLVTTAPCPAPFVGVILVISTGGTSATVSGSITITPPGVTLPIGPETIAPNKTVVIGVCALAAVV